MLYIKFRRLTDYLEVDMKLGKRFVESAWRGWQGGIEMNVTKIGCIHVWYLS